MIRKILIRSAVVLATFGLGMLTPTPSYSLELTEPQQAQTIMLSVGSGVLATSQQGFVSIYVADESVADVSVRSENAVYVSARAPGKTAIFGLDANEKVVFAVPVEVTQDLAAMRRVLQQIAPGGAISLAQVGKAVVISGEVAKQEQIDALSKMAASFVGSPDHVVNSVQLRRGPQVNLQVRIAEVSRSLDEELGLNWASFGNITGIAAEADPSRVALLDLNIPNLLQALSQDGLVTILAEPNLSARSGETANFLAGGEYPYEVTSEGETTIQFKDFGASLAFTPDVDAQGRIGLKVAAEVSELSFLPQSPEIPALSSRRVETSVDLRAGESLAIAGLITNSSSQNMARLPGFGSLPVLGALFRSSAFQKGKTELVVIVTPYLVEPTSATLATPLDFFDPPTDAERLLLGQLEGSQSGTKLTGAAGFTWK